MLTIANTLNLAAGSTAYFEVDKSTGTSDMVAANSVSFAGTLMVTNVAGALAPGDTFQLFSTGMPNGNFTSVVVSGATGTFNPTTGMLTIGDLVADYPTNITVGINGSTLSMTWPESHLGWYAQSNYVDVAKSAMWFDIPNSETGTSLNITVDPAMEKVFYRLRKP